MQQEGSGAMEKKPFASQPPAQFRNSGISGDKKCDFAPHRNGRSRKHGPNNGNRITDNQSPRPISNAKWSKSYRDKRPRQRGCYEDRQREEVAESEEGYHDLVSSTRSRKGNANHLLNFKFTPRESEGTGRWGRGRYHNGVRNRGYKKLPSYNKEQFLQASCQFVVREGGEYVEQAVNPDALVSWDMIELVKSFATEPVTCPICLQIPFAGKITKCGHIYCWACILHYLKLGDNNYRKCPICYEAVMVDDLKSVQVTTVPDFSVGDDIEMTLMKKSKGSVQVMPKAEWEDRKGKPMNLQDGCHTRFMKLLVASLEQIQREVIDLERVALSAHLAEAEEDEATFIQMAQTLLDKRESSLKKVFKRTAKRKQTQSIPGLVLPPTPSESSSEDEDVKQEQPLDITDVKNLAPDPTMNSNKPSKVYVDAFEDVALPVAENVPVSADTGASIDDSMPAPSQESATDNSGGSTASEEDSSQKNDNEDSLSAVDSTPDPLPKSPDQAVPDTPLSLEKTVETSELPQNSPPNSAYPKSNFGKPKDTFHFYQASSGQHIYLHSLNAHCLIREYGSLEESPEKIKATILSIERCFMTEEVRKRMRYLNHVPLTCEFYVIELEFAPPLVSEETLNHFQDEFERKQKARLRKMKDEKMRSKKFEVEYKKSFGIYPEVQIPLSNLAQFPSHLAASASASPPRDGESEFVTIAPSNLASEDDSKSLTPSSPGSINETISYAQLLKAGNSPPQTGVWGRSNVRIRTASGGSSTGSRDVGDGSDGEDLPAPSYNASMSHAIEQAMHSMDLRRQSTGNELSVQAVPGGKKKKRKEKQLLFATTMARKK